MVASAMVASLALALRAQQATTFKGGTDFRFPLEYWQASNGVVRLKTLLTGKHFEVISNNISLIALSQPRIESFREDGTTLVWIALSPAAIADMNDKTVRGSTNFFFRSADDRLYFTGVGFLWQQESSVLILSNKAFTWIDRSRLYSTNAPKTSANATNKMKMLPILPLIVAAKMTAAELETPPARPGLKIWGDINVLMLTNNSALYSNNVIVIDPPSKPGAPETRLTCDWLTVKQTPQNQVDEIAAHGHVAIDQGDLHGRGNYGLYTASDERVALVGTYDPADTNNLRPYLYKLVGTNFSSAVTNRGDAIIYNRLDNTLTTLKSVTDLPSTLMKSFSPTNASRTNSNASPAPSK